MKSASRVVEREFAVDKKETNFISFHLFLVAMAKIFQRRNFIADPLLQFLWLWETTINPAVPHNLPINSDPKITPWVCPEWPQYNFCYGSIIESRQNFLSHPGRSQHPVAARAVVNRYRVRRG